MRRYLLDTSILIGHLFGRQPVVTLLRPWLAHREVATSVLVFAESVEYIRLQPDAAVRRRQLNRLLRDIHPYPMTVPILESYADLRLRMRQPRGPGLIGDIGTLIAATALVRGLTVVTTDGDFLRVPNLSVTLLDRKSLAVVSERVP